MSREYLSQFIETCGGHDFSVVDIADIRSLSFIKDATALAVNSQTDIDKFHKGEVIQYFNEYYPGVLCNEAIKK